MKSSSSQDKEVEKDVKERRAHSGLFRSSRADGHRGPGAAGASFISPGAFFTRPALSVSVSPFLILLIGEEFNEANGRAENTHGRPEWKLSKTPRRGDSGVKSRARESPHSALNTSLPINGAIRPAL